MGELVAALVLLMAPSVDACDALAALDVVRAAAWEASDEDLLAKVYANGAASEDVRRLRAWRARGIQVEGMRTDRSSCRPRGAAEVEVVERLGPMIAVLTDGSRRALPADRRARRVVTLGRVEGWWRITTVRTLG